MTIIDRAAFTCRNGIAISATAMNSGGVTPKTGRGFWETTAPVPFTAPPRER
jgi:hypothetical protein